MHAITLQPGTYTISLRSHSKTPITLMKVIGVEDYIPMERAIPNPTVTFTVSPGTPTEYRISSPSQPTIIRN